MGLLEQIAADVAAIKAAVAAMQGNLAQSGTAGTLTQHAVASPAPVDPAALERARLEAQLAALNGGTAQAAPAAQVPANVTSDQLMALIHPHLENAAVKEALGAAMRAAGINALPEAQPHQYGDLYARFQAVITQHAANPAPAPATSII